MRSSLLVFALVGCVRGASPSAVAWPKPSATQADGGESLAPRPSAHALSASSADFVEAAPAAPLGVAPEPSAVQAAPTASTPAAESAPDDPITTDEIVIEITDD